MPKPQLRTIGLYALGAFTLATASTPVHAAPGDSVQDRLDRLEALLNDVNDNVDGIVVGRNSASLNAAVCVSTGVGTAITLAGNAELGARWDVAVLGDIRADLNIGVTGDSTMSADVCINVPIVSIGETAIPTDSDRRITLTTENGQQVKLTRSETEAFDDALAQVASELKTMGLTMSGGIGELWNALNADAILSPDQNPLLDPEEMVASVPEVVLTGSVSGTPFEKLPLAGEAEDTIKSVIGAMDPCELVQLNTIMRDVPGLEELICSDALMSGVTQIAGDVGALPGTINAGFSDLTGTVNNQFATMTNTVNNGFNSMTGQIASSTAVVTTQIDGATTVITSEVGGFVSQSTNEVKNHVNVVSNGLQNAFNGSLAQLNSSISAMSSSVDWIRTRVNAIGIIVGDVWSIVDEIWDKVKKILNKLP